MKRATQIAVVAVIYLVTARLGLMMDAVAGFATLVWPPTGIALTALLLFGYGIWPGIALGAFLANVLTGAPPLVALGISFGNTLEALAGAYALRRIPGFSNALDRLRDVLGFLVLTAIGSTTLSATIGVASITMGGIAPLAQFGKIWRSWWLGDVVGDFIIAPLLLTWAVWLREPSPPLRRITLKCAAEACGLALCVVAIGIFVFTEKGSFGAYVFFPSLIWAALRFGQRGVITTMFEIAVVTLVGTTLNYGPFVHATLAESLFSLQAFIVVTSGTFLILGAAMSERHVLYSSEKNARAIAEETARARDTFISVASHELRNPLSVLHLTIETLDRSNTKRDWDRTIQTAAKIRRQIQRLTHLVDNLLDTSRLKSGKVHLERKESDIASIVRDVVSRFEDDIRRAHCAVNLHAGFPIVGIWDPMRLDQIATNLLSNALKYGAGSSIEIRVEGDTDRARLIVSDHGIGIAKEAQTRIFEQFERVDNSVNVSGLGLGLWIVRQIVLAFDGSIRVASEPGQGGDVHS